MVKTAFFTADQDEDAQRGSGRPIPPLVSEIQAATTNGGTKPQGDLTPDFLALSLSPRANYSLADSRCRATPGHTSFECSSGSSAPPGQPRNRED